MLLEQYQIVLVMLALSEATLSGTLNIYLRFHIREKMDFGEVGK